MLLLTPALVSLLLVSPVLSGITLAKPIAEKRSVVDLTYGAPSTRLLAQIQGLFGNVVHSWSMISAFSLSRILSMDDSHYVSSVKTQCASIFQNLVLTDATTRTNATWGLARITQADKLQEQNSE